jgi:DNA (cytosine-5)-methyltransferase 1
LRTKLKVLDLFSGIGGFSLGLHSTGIFETTKFVEFDSFCQKVLNKNFPNIPIEGDIRNVKGQEFEADVITGGFPCQPFSVAGKQKGTNDNRYLWPEMFRLIKEIKPEFVIGENVQGLINLQNGMVLRQVQDQLEGEGFEVQCFLIPASGIGAWHQRNRVWIVGHSKHNGLLAAEKRCRDQEINGRSQEGQNQTIQSERTSGSRDNENYIQHRTQEIGRTREQGTTIGRQDQEGITVWVNG